MDTKDKREDKNRFLILILSVATFLVALVGATFSYFTALITETNGKQSVLVSTQTVEGVTYEASDALTLLDAIPGQSKTATFKVSNNNASATLKYNLVFVPDVDDFNNEDGDLQLIVTLSGGAIVGSKTIDYTDGENAKEETFAEDIEIAANEEHEYTIKVEFVELNVPQNGNQTKNFVGHVEVRQELVTAAPQTPAEP